MISLNFTFILQIINFLILMWVLYRLLYKPVTQFLEQRSANIRELIEGTEKDRQAAAKNLEEAKRVLAEKREEGLKLIEKARQVAIEEEKRILTEAKEAAGRICEEARVRMGQEVEQAKRELQAQVADLSLLVAEQVIHKSLSEKDHRKLVDEYTREIGRLH
ncbi:MAG: F0F1 ATP synthase subunit B [bacterium]|nr:F0F1 ATP synthase subunit B [bacterium]